MKKVFIIARWEYVERVKSKMFLISLLVMPIIMVSMGILPGLLADQEEEMTKVIGVVDPRGSLANLFAERMQRGYTRSSGEPLYVVRPLAAGRDGDLERVKKKADEMVMDNQIDGYCILGMPEMNDVEYRSKNVGDYRIPIRIEETVRNILAEQRLVSLGLDPILLDELRSPVNVRSLKLSRMGEEEEAGFLHVFFSAYVFLMMLFFMILSSGQLLVRSVIEEKMNRIVEVLVSSCSPTQLMTGKILGLSGLGFTQMIVWGLIGFAISSVVGVTLLRPEHMLLLVLYFVLGYLLYAAIFIGVGSPVTTEQEAQHVTSYLVIVLTVPLVLTVPALQNPDAAWISILTYIPLLTPTMMGLRLSIDTPPLWEILLTVAVMLISIYVAMIAAGRIFRIAILATGKRAKLSEMVAWARLRE